jgi:hypothetical protein
MSLIHITNWQGTMVQFNSCCAVRAMALLPDGRVASGSSCGDDYVSAIWLWDPSGSAEPVPLMAHSRSVSTLAALPDGRLAAGYDDDTILVWDPSRLADPRAYRVLLEGHSRPPSALAVLPDGRLASGSMERDCTIRIWDPAGSAEPVVLSGHTRTVLALAVLADGRLASGSADCTMRVWDPSGSAPPIVLAGHTDPVNCLAVLPDGRLASGAGIFPKASTKDWTVRVWSLPQAMTDTEQIETEGRAVEEAVHQPSVWSQEGGDVQGLIDSLGSVRTSLVEPEAMEELVRKGAGAVPTLIENLTRSSFVPVILGKMGDSRAFEPLTELAQSRASFDSDPDAYGGYACEMAVRGLGLLGDRRALPLLKKIATETNVGEILIAANDAIEGLQRREQDVLPELEGMSEWEVERIAGVVRGGLTSEPVTGPADFRAQVQKEQPLLAELAPVAEEAATSFFARLRIAEPNRYRDAAHAFSGFRQYTVSSQGSPVHVFRLRLHNESVRPDFLYVHLADEALPLGFLVCAIAGGGFMGYYKTGEDLRKTLGC